jgi:hypothetical protein
MGIMAEKATEEQKLYASILNKGMLVGLLALVGTFIVYAAGIMKPMIPLGEVQNYWVMSVADYLHESGIQAGWAWAGNLGYGDMLNFAPIAFLSGLTVICYLAIVPGLLKKKDTAYVVLALIEILVLCVAASGILGSGGH